MHPIQFRRLTLALALSSLAAVQAAPIAESTFDVDSDGWQPWLTSTAEAMSPGNPYLSIEADGSGVKGKMITFNSDPAWTGDYFGAGVTEIQFDVKNMSSLNDLHLRVAVGNRASPMQDSGTWWLSGTTHFVPTNSDWTHVTLSLREIDLVRVGNLNGQLGTESYQTTFGDIRNIRILSSLLPLGAIGSEFFGDVAIDNIMLVPEPRSTAFLLSCLIGTFCVLRRRPR